jgi:hypothetical protein
MRNFLLLNWGNLASIVGLVFSFLAFIFSKRASRAAKQAQQFALTRSLGEDINNASKTASEIAAYVRSEKPEMAVVRIGELISATSYTISRWDAKLSESSKNRLLKTREQLHLVHDLLGKSAIADLSAKDRTALARFCREVPTSFVEEYGVAVREVDKRV